MGFRVVGTEHNYPAEIHAKEVGVRVEAWLNVHLLGEELASTPDYYVDDLGPTLGLNRGETRKL